MSESSPHLRASSDPLAVALRRPAELSAVFTERPLILLADYPADTPGGGAEVLRSLLKEEDRAKIIWATPNAVPARSPGSWRSHATLCPDVPVRPLDIVLRTGLDPRLAKRLSDHLAKLVERENATGVWIIMHGAGVFVAAKFLQEHRVPVHLSVHDDPVNFTLMSRRRFFLAPLVARAFASALRRANSVDAASKGMTKMYAARYGIEAPNYHRGVDPSAPRLQRHTAPPGLSIGILGNTYGSKNVVALAEAMIHVAKRIDAEPRLVLIGQPHAGLLKARFGQAIVVEDLPYLGEPDTVEQLARCFLLYLTYPFSRLYRTLRRSSFPTKLSTYGLAGRPLLLHTPDDSQLMQIAEDRAYATAWTNLDPRAGGDLLRQAWRDFSSQRDFAPSASRLLDTYFHWEKNRGTLFDRLNRLPCAGDTGLA